MEDCINWCNSVFKPVETLPPSVEATRNHGYILPDNSIHILNYDGNGYIRLN